MAHSKKTTGGEPAKHQISIRLKHELYEDLRALAAADDRELATYVVLQLEKLVAPQRPIKHLDAENLFGPDSE